MSGQQSMRICFISNGNSNHIQMIANYFAQKGHDVHLINYDLMNGYDSRIEIHQLKCLPFMGKSQNYVNSITWPWQVRKLVSSIKPDLLNAHYLTIYGLLASLSGFHPLIVTAWGSDILWPPKIKTLWKFIIKYTLKRADLLICLFEQSMIDRTSKIIRSDLKIISLPYGTDVAVFKKIKIAPN